ncbi:MAG TPA: phosphotransferase [Gemmatimonadales bacterium]|nr:phosphotransferase [Gemmatimonadales bacterium]
MRSPLFKPSDAQRAALRAQSERLRQPEAMLELLRSGLPDRSRPDSVLSCALQSAHPDRAMLRAQTRLPSGAERAFAVKIHGDDIAERVWSFTRTLGGPDSGDDRDGVCVPIGFVPSERALISPWIDGALLSEVLDTRTAGLLRRAAVVTAELHELPTIPEPPTTVTTLLDETLARCDRLRTRWPGALEHAEPLLEELRAAAPALDHAAPAPVHGDLGGAQFLWTGTRLVLFDWDRFGYTDPAFDVGHFLAQLDRIGIVDPTLQATTPQWATGFARAYYALRPGVSRRNIEFFRAMTLVWKMHTICRVHPNAWPQLVPRLAVAAHAAVQAVATPT